MMAKFETVPMAELKTRLPAKLLPLVEEYKGKLEKLGADQGGRLTLEKGDDAKDLMEDALAVEEAGAFAVVLEMVPSGVAADVTAALSIPTISVGAGPHCDGQLLVWTDWAGFTTGRVPKFVKRYAEIAELLQQAAEEFRADVESGVYPGPEHEYSE